MILKSTIHKPIATPKATPKKPSTKPVQAVSPLDDIRDTYEPIAYEIAEYDAINIIVDITRKNDDVGLPYLNISLNDRKALSIPCNAIAPLIKALIPLNRIADDKGLKKEWKK